MKARVANVWYTPSSSDPSREYTTILWADGRVSCNCRGWTFKRPGQDRSCQHTQRYAPSAAPGDVVVSGRKTVARLKTVAQLAVPPSVDRVVTRGRPEETGTFVFQGQEYVVPAYTKPPAGTRITAGMEVDVVPVQTSRRKITLAEEERD